MLGQFLRFGIVGTVGLGVDVAVLYLAAPFTGWYVGRMLSFLAAATVTWSLNRRFTFRSGESVTSAGRPWRQYLHYLLTMLGGGAVNYLVYAVTLHFVDGRFAPVVGVALGSLAGLSLNFLAARYLVFRPASQPKTHIEADR